MSNALRSYNVNSYLGVGEKLSDYQVQNNTGGYVYQVEDKARLERFLILGVDKGTYYVSEADLTKQNVDWLVQLIKKDSKLVLDTVREVSTSGRAYRNGPAIFVLALVLNHGTSSDKSLAASMAPEVARTATMVFELAQYIENLGGWGRAKRTAIANWFTSKTPEALAYQAVKYRQRNGWTLRDLMRLSHPRGVDQNVGNFVLGKYQGKFSDYTPGMPEIVHGFMQMQRATSTIDVILTLQEYRNLPWESIPTQFLKEPVVWKQLFENGQLKGQALLRNVTRMAKIGAFDDSDFAQKYATELANEEMIKKTRLHPMQYLLASVTYVQGQMNRKDGWYWDTSRNKTWVDKKIIRDALDAGFYSSFSAITPADKLTTIGLDVSGSMSSPALGVDLSACEIAAAMAMVTVRTEPDVNVYGFARDLKKLAITKSDSFDSAMRKTKGINFGSTNPGLLIRDALNRRQLVDTFIVITDNEVNSGQHPSGILRQYRDSVNPNARLVVVGTTATDFTLADPRDPGMMDVAGFDTNAPNVIADFSAGRF